MKRIFGIGETVLDVIFRGGQPTAANPGGSTFNSMISLGRAALRGGDYTVSMVTEIGSDRIGDIIDAFMKDNGVSDSYVIRPDNSQTTVAMAFLDEHDNAQYEFYKDRIPRVLSAEDASGVVFEKGDIVLFGSYYSINPAIRPFTKTLLEKARKAGAILYYDINFRKNYINDLPALYPSIVENCVMADFVRGSDEDFTYLFGTSNPQEIYTSHMSGLCRNLICTCGSDPAHVFTPRFYRIFPVEKVKTVSTIGAGDNYNAGFIYALAVLGVEATASMTEEDWENCICYAGKFSANVCGSVYNYIDKNLI